MNRVMNKKLIAKNFRFKPLMLAFALLSPLHAFAADSPNNLAEPQQVEQQQHYFHRDHVLGTSFDVVLTGISTSDAQHAFNAMLEEIASLDKKLSIWRADSEISALNQQKSAEVSPELFEVIAACETWRNKTCGAFDARLGQLIGLWEESQGIMQPDESARVAITNQLNPNSVSMNQETQQITLDQATAIAPDGYAKGYIIDRAMMAARQAVPTLEGVLVDIGGDMRVWGESPKKSTWSIGVQDAFNHHDLAVPSEVLSLTDHAVAFSGKGYRDVNGQSHLLDPKTGLALQHVEQCLSLIHI